MWGNAVVVGVRAERVLPHVHGIPLYTAAYYGGEGVGQRLLTTAMQAESATATQCALWGSAGPCMP